jgi:hypothetical protein
MQHSPARRIKNIKELAGMPDLVAVLDGHRSPVIVKNHAC